MTLSTSILILYIATKILGKALLNMHWSKFRKREDQLASWNQGAKIFKRKSCCQPKTRTIPLLIDDPGHKVLSTEA